MDGSNMSRNRSNDYLGVNKVGKQIRKSPLLQPNFVPTSGVGGGGGAGGGSDGGGGGSGGNGSSNLNRQPQPQVYNISKSDFRSIVQQLTGSPSRQDPMPRPPNNPPKHPSLRLQRIRPPPLTPINRPHMPPVVAAPAPVHNNVMQHPPQGPNVGMAAPMVGYNNNGFGVAQPQFGQPSPRGMQPLGHGDWGWPNPSLSPISAYMQQLQSCISDGGPNPAQPPMQPQVFGSVPSQPPMQPRAQGHQSQYPVQGQGLHPMQPQFPGQVQGQGRHPSSGLLPNPNPPLLPSPRMNGPPALPSPRMNDPGLLPSPRMNGPGLLPSPSSDFLLPSPSFFNNLSPAPRSPYPLLSPGNHFPPPLSPNFAFSPMGQSGFLAPLSPGIAFPSSPSGFFPISSPRWRD